MYGTDTIQARVVISGTLVFKDKDGQVVGTAEFTTPMPEPEPESKEPKP